MFADPLMKVSLPAVKTNQEKITDGDSFIREIFLEHGNAMFSYATRITGDRFAAEDVVQETMLRAWKHSGSLTQDKGSVRGWLLTVIRNIETDRIRARHARPLEVTEAQLTGPVEANHAERVTTMMVVVDALNHLPNGQRFVLEHVYLHGRTTRETAQCLGLPLGTVKSRAHYGLRALRRRFVEQGLTIEGVEQEHR